MPDRTELQRLGLLDGDEEIEFNRFTELAKKMLDVPVALFSIIDAEHHRQFLKSAVGLAEPWMSRRETPLTHSICRFVQDDKKPVVLRDTREVERMAGHLAIPDLNAIAYMGVPITNAQNEVIGALCVIDDRPRDWSEDDLSELQVIASAMTGLVHLRVALEDARHARLTAESISGQLVEKDNLFNDLARNIPGAIFRYVRHPDDRDEIEYMSTGCLAIWEISSDEIRGDPARLWQVIDPEDLPDMAASVQNSALNLSPWEHRWRITTPSGKRKWLHGTGMPKRQEDGTIQWNSLILDVTVEVTAQQKLDENMSRLHNAQKQESIGRIAGGIAHDFNNLMAIILGNSELLLGDSADEEPTVYLKEIQKAALRGGELTKRLLTYARRSELVPEVLSVNQSVLDMSDLLRRTIPENIEIETTLMAGLWNSKVDKSFLESALLNLVVNARDAMPRGGRLTIETANVRIGEDYIEDRGEDLTPGRYVMLAVTDNGVGIDAGLLPMIFEPFFSTKTPDRGNGLGLAMVQGFAKQSGGTVRIYSEKGVGTSMKIYLKAHESVEGRPQPEPVGVPTSQASGRILLAEDEDSLRRVVRIFLQNAGYQVDDAPTGDQAHEIFLRSPDAFDLVVTDIIMPGRLQGPMLVRKIREIRDDLGVVYISGYPHEANVHGNGIRANDVSLTKPLERKAFITAVDQAIRRSRRAAQCR